jgi:hypothetical protein
LSKNLAPKVLCAFVFNSKETIEVISQLDFSIIEKFEVALRKTENSGSQLTCIVVIAVKE